MGGLRREKGKGKGKLPLPLREGVRGSVFCCIAALLLTLPAFACPTPRQMDGFRTCADVAQAEQEGKLVLYATDPEFATEQVLARFHEAFPKIQPTYLRLQGGALYARILAERQGGVFTADVLQPADMGFALDFQKRGGYMRYLSPELDAYKVAYRSSPEGDFTWGAMVVAGIAYNPKLVTEAEAPRDWPDVLNPKWADAISVKVTISGLQHTTWFMLRKLYGNDFWGKLEPSRLHAFDSYVQQFDRLVNGQDKVAITAQYSGYLMMKAKGAPVGFVIPPSGLTATPQPWGIVKEAPHPAAAQLFMDWFLSLPGQTANVKYQFTHSLRPDAPAPPGGVKASEFRLLVPDDWHALEASHAQYVKEWNKLTGMR
jgi:iron(III) transport system substrate-binding protein